MAFTYSQLNVPPYEVQGRTRIVYGTYQANLGTTTGNIKTSLTKITWGQVTDTSTSALATSRTMLTQSFPITSATAAVSTINTTQTGVYYFIENVS